MSGPSDHSSDCIAVLHRIEFRDVLFIVLIDFRSRCFDPLATVYMGLHGWGDDRFHQFSDEVDGFLWATASKRRKRTAAPANK